MQSDILGCRNLTSAIVSKVEFFSYFSCPYPAVNDSKEQGHPKIP
jgi:hypothetical protein